jgi:hypothetical protein
MDGLKLTFDDGSWVLDAPFGHRAGGADLQRSGHRGRGAKTGGRRARLDYKVNDTRTNTPDGGGFFEQLGDFFRRNVHWFLVTGFALLLLQDVFGTHGVLAMRRSEKEAAGDSAEHQAAR